MGFDELAAAGWSSEWQKHFDATVASLQVDELELARVVRQDRGAVLVMTTTGIRLARLGGKAMGAVLVGDWVVVAADSVAAILERRSLLVRKDAHDDAPQPLVANVDLVVIVCGLDRPVNQRRIERAVTQTRQSGAEPLVVLTKSDLDHQSAEQVAFLEPLRVDVLVVSSEDGTGLGDLELTMKDKTSVLVGESGAGKSTLLNALLKDEVVLTGEVRAKNAKGRHTTTRRELHLTSFGVVIDTPGIRSVGLWADEESVDSTYPEIAELAEQCRFTDCQHGGEPGCAIAVALESGEVTRERVDAWRSQREEIRENEQRQNEASRRRPEAKSASSIREHVRSRRNR